MVPTPPPLPLSSSSHQIITTTTTRQTPHTHSTGNYFQAQHNNSTVTARATQLRHTSPPPPPSPPAAFNTNNKDRSVDGKRHATIGFSQPISQTIPASAENSPTNFANAIGGSSGHRIQQSRSFRDFQQQASNESEQEHMRIVHHPNKLSVMPIVKSFAFVSRARNIFQQTDDQQNHSTKSTLPNRNTFSSIAAGNSAKLLNAFGGSTQQLNSSYSTMRTPPPTSLIYPPGHPAASSSRPFTNPHNLQYESNSVVNQQQQQAQKRRSSHRSAVTEREARTTVTTTGGPSLSTSHPDLHHVHHPHSSHHSSSQRPSSRHSTKSTSTSGTPAEIGHPHRHNVAARHNSQQLPAFTTNNNNARHNIPPAPPMALFGNGQIPTARDPHNLWSHSQNSQQNLINQQSAANLTQAKHHFANRKLPAIAGNASSSEYDDGISSAPAGPAAAAGAATLSSSSPTNTTTKNAACCERHKPGCCYCCCCQRCLTARCCFGLVASLVLLGIGLVVFLIYLLSSNTLVSSGSDPSAPSVIIAGHGRPSFREHQGPVLVPLPANSRGRSSFVGNRANDRAFDGVLGSAPSSTTTEESVYSAIEERLLWKMATANNGVNINQSNQKPKLPPSMQLPAEDGVSKVPLAPQSPLPPPPPPPVFMPPIHQHSRFGMSSTKRPEYGFMPPSEDAAGHGNNNGISLFDANDIQLMPGLVALGPPSPRQYPSHSPASSTAPSNSIEPTLAMAENVPMETAKKADPTAEIYTVFTAVIDNNNSSFDSGNTPPTTRSPENSTSMFFTNDAATFYTQPPDYFAPNNNDIPISQPGQAAMLTTLLPASENSVTIVMDTTDFPSVDIQPLPADDGPSSPSPSTTSTVQPVVAATAPGVSCRDTFSAFKCADGQKCLHISMWCDNVADCQDGSDEPAECQYQCPTGFFACLNRTIQQNSLAFQFYGGRAKRHAIHQHNAKSTAQKEYRHPLAALPLLRSMTYFSSFSRDSPLLAQRMAQFTAASNETDAAMYGNLTHRSARPLASAVRVASSSAGSNRRVARVVPDNNVVNGRNKPARHNGSTTTTQATTSTQRRQRRHEWCIPDSLVCNGVSDCQDLSDEYFCHCTTEQIRCADGVCRSRGLICTGHHLRYGGDYANGGRTFLMNNINQADGGVQSAISTTNKENSDNGGATCLANAKAEQELCNCVESIPSDKVCDGFPDCLDSIDERDCSGCQVENEFACWQSKYVCISRRNVCDGIPFDCPNNEDELDCIRLLPQGERLSDATDFLGRMTTTGVLVARRNGSPFSPVCSSDLQWKAGTWESVFNADASCQYVGYARALRIEHLQLPDTLPPSATFAVIGAPTPTPATLPPISMFSTSSRTIAPEPNSFIAYFTHTKSCPSSEIVQLHCAEMLCSAPNETIQTFDSGGTGTNGASVSHGTVAAGTLPAARYLPEQQWYLPAIVQIHRRPATAATLGSAATSDAAEKQWQFHCGGVLVHDSAVVTSSACLTDPSPEPKFPSGSKQQKQARTVTNISPPTDQPPQYEYVVIAGSFWPATNPNLIQQRTVSHSSAVPSVNSARLPSFITTPMHSTTTPRMPQLAIMHVRVPFALSDYLHAACLPQPRDTPHSTTSFESGTADPYRLAFSSIASNQILRGGSASTHAAALSTAATPLISSVLFGESVPGAVDSVNASSVNPTMPTELYLPTTSASSTSSFIPIFLPVPVDLPAADDNSTSTNTQKATRKTSRRKRALPLQLNQEEEERLLSHFLLSEGEKESSNNGQQAVVAPLSMSFRQTLNSKFHDHELLTVVASVPTSSTFVVAPNNNNNNNGTLSARSSAPTTAQTVTTPQQRVHKKSKAAGILFDEQPECVVVGWNASDPNSGDGSAQLTVWPHAQIAPTAECEKHLIREATYSILDNAYQRNGLICVRLESREQVVDAVVGRTEYDVPVPLNDRGSALMCRARIDRPWLFHGVLADFQVVKVATTNLRRTLQAHHSIRDRPIASSLAFVGDQKQYHQQRPTAASLTSTTTTISNSTSRTKRAAVVANLTSSFFPGIPQPYFHHNAQNARGSGSRRGRIHSQRTKTATTTHAEDALNESTAGTQTSPRQSPHNHHHHYQQASREEHYYYYDVFAFYISVRDQLSWLRKEVGLTAARRRR